MAVENITLNLIPTGDTPSIHAAQYDVERPFTVTLKEGADDFAPTGYDIELQVRKVDNNIVTAIPTSTSGNVVTFNTTEQMTACSGTNLAELQLSKDDQTIATLHFYLVVQRDVLAGGLTSQSEIYDLEEQIAAIVPEVIGDEYYTAEEVDEKIAEIPTFDPTNYYTKSQLYTKTETNGLLSAKANTSALSTVAFSGSYTDLANKPTIPAAQVQSNWSQSDNTKVDYIKNKPTIPTDAEQLPITSGSSTNTKSYIDSGLSGKADTSELYDILPTEQGSGAIAHFTDGADNIPLKSCEIEITPDLTGHTEANLVVCNKNLYEPTSVSQSAGGITCTNNNDGTYTCINQATHLQQFSLGTIKLPAGTYVLSGCPIGGSLTTFDLRWTNSYIDTGSGVTITSDGNTTSHVVITIRNGYNCGSGITFKPMICKVDTPNPDYAHFEKKSGTTYNIPFGQTVTTGGTLDVINGVLTVGGVETQLTPVNPKTISGVNNIYSNTGNVDVTIRADIGLYIDKKISSLAQG